MDVNPYFNSLIGPRARTKRSNRERKPQREQRHEDKPQPQSAWKSEAYIRMLDDSFPNPIGGGSSGDVSDLHVRVKRLSTTDDDKH